MSTDHLDSEKLDQKRWSSNASIHSQHDNGSRRPSAHSTNSKMTEASRHRSLESVHSALEEKSSRRQSALLSSCDRIDEVRRQSTSSNLSKASSNQGKPTVASLQGDKVSVECIPEAVVITGNGDNTASKNEMSNGGKGMWNKFKNWSKSNRNSDPVEEDKPSRYEEFYTKHQKMIRINFYLILIGAFVAFLIAGLVLNFEKTLPLLIITAVVVGYLIYAYIRDTYGAAIYKFAFEPVFRYVDKKWWILKWLVYLAVLAFLIFWIAFDTARDPKRLISFAGLVMYVVLCYVFSKNRRKVYWRQVLWGIGLQFILGILILRTTAGFAVFNFVGNQVERFLSYANAGASFVFGTAYTAHFFAFAVLPIVVFFSAAISVLYYFGVMSWIIVRIAWLMQITMKTSATESLNAAGNIFIGQTEAPLLIRPFIQYMTVSELHAVMTGGMATIAGSVLGAFILFGVPAAHLLTASVMSAPAALAISKLMYPEVEKNVENLDGDLDVDIAASPDRNLIEAASGGASASIPLVANIAANLIAFLSALKFLNAVLGWLGAMVNYPQLSFQVICSYVFMPLAFMMGVEWQDSHRVAELIGVKTFLNEFVAYTDLAKLIKNRQNCVQPYMSLRSEVIATYACCGFSNIGSIGILLGGLTPMAPNRRSDLARIAVRALISATVACFMTACLAGILYEPSIEELLHKCPDVVNTTVAGNSSN